MKQEQLQDLELQTKLLERINVTWKQKAAEYEKTAQSLRKKTQSQSRLYKKLEKEKQQVLDILSEKSSKSVLPNKKLIALTALILSIPIIYFAANYPQSDLVDEQTELKSKYVIENLRGDTMGTYATWKLNEIDTLKVSIINSANLSSEKLAIVEEAIFSTELYKIDDSWTHKGPKGTESTYYLGWEGALQSTSDDTKYLIPKKLMLLDNSHGSNIVVTLTSIRDTDGYSGFTKSILDDSDSEILKSQVTIYGANKLSDESLRTVVRHEFGHALGLAHTSAQEDLMHPTVTTAFPYISECNLEALEFLYDGNQQKDFVCRK